MMPEAGWQAVSIEKHGTFPPLILIGKVNVIKFLGYRCTLFVPAHDGGYNSVAVHGSRLKAAGSQQGKLARF